MMFTEGTSSARSARRGSDDHPPPSNRPWRKRMKLSFTVQGEARPLARHRTRVVKTKSGRTFASNYDPKENEHARGYIRIAAHGAMSAAGMKRWMEGPIELRVIFYISQPDSKRVANPSRVRPDILLSKLCPSTKPDFYGIVLYAYCIVLYASSSFCDTLSALFSYKSLA